MGRDGHTERSTEAWLACVNVPSFSLQILLSEHPEWRDRPAVVVDADKPTGFVRALNSAAGRRGIRPWMRYATALSIVSDLQAGTVSRKQLRESSAAVIEVLQHFSPDVEQSSLDDQSFWLRYEGMQRLFPDPDTWVQKLRASLKARGFFATAALGYSRFGTYVGAKLSKGVRIFSRRTQQDRAVAQASIDLLPLNERAVSRLQALGISSIGGFRDLDANQLRRKLGEQAYAVHCFAAETDAVPLQSSPEAQDLHFEKRLQHPLRDRDRLLQSIEELVHAAVRRIVRDVWAVRRLRLTLELEPDTATDSAESSRLETDIRPATPTQDPRLLMRLVSLRLETLAPGSAVVAVSLDPDWVALNLEPGELFHSHPSRNVAAGSRSLALLRAELGEDAVCVAEPADAHLPEHRYAWGPCSGLVPSRNAGGKVGASATERPRLKLVRRILAQPAPLSASPTLRSGPYILHEGWWLHEDRRHLRTSEGSTRTCEDVSSLSSDGAGARAYYYAEIDGDLLWIYYDGAADAWMIQGYVE